MRCRAALKMGCVANIVATINTVIAKLSPSQSLRWAELALILISPTRESSDLAGNQQNMLCNICRSSTVEPKTICKILQIWKTTSMEDDLHER